jgi:hypothetical protein
MLSIGWETYGFLESESSNQRNRERLGDEIYTWAEKAIDKGLEKVQQADECELAYYEGYVGGTIATAILVPATLEEHIAGLVVRSGVKLLGVSAKTINGVLQLSKAGRVFMESGQGWAKIWFRNKEIPLSEVQIEELKRLLDKGSIDVEESGLVAKTDDGNTFLEGLVSGAGELFRGVTKSDFLNTVGDFANGANAQIADQAWDLWKQQKWSELENLFNTNNINKYDNVILPPNNGAINIVKKTLDPADFNGNLIIDRYGATTGKFTAPANTPFGQRALPASYASQTPQKYKVLKPIPNVEEGQVIPWFNQPGMGIQYKLEKSVQYYLDEGYLQIIP